jgi:hypothetical protein
VILKIDPRHWSSVHADDGGSRNRDIFDELRFRQLNSDTRLEDEGGSEEEK